MDFFDIYEKEVRQQYEQTPEPETGMFEVEKQKPETTDYFDYDKLANIVFEKIKEERKEQRTETTGYEDKNNTTKPILYEETETTSSKYKETTTTN